MLYRKFGKTNEDVSILGFGCMRLPLIEGGDPSQIDEELSIKMVRYAIDEGVNYIDTAYPYHGTSRTGGGASEPFVAKALKDGYREKVNIATKLPSWLVDTREDMERFLNEQLERLETDHIDFYLVHGINAGRWPILKAAGINEFLDAAIADGRIRYAGFSFHDKLDLFIEVVDYYDWSFCQIQLNYLDIAFQAGITGLEYAASKNLGITIMEPLKGGKLVNQLPEEALEVFNQASVKRKPADWALRWVYNRPEVSVALSGMNSMEQVKENLQTASEAEANVLTAEEMEMFDKVHAIFQEKNKVGCTSCGYCMPCPSGINIPGCFTAYNNFYIFDENTYFMISPDQNASNCVECGECETKCPQSINIIDELKNVTAALEN